MSKFIINGGTALIGKIKLSGAKNAGFKEIIAGLFTDELLSLSNVSRVSDVLVLKEIIENLGGRVEYQNHKIAVSGKKLQSFEIAPEFGAAARVSSMLVGPLLYRFGKAAFPSPGVDKIGQRPIDRHLDGLKALGAEI